MTRGVPMPPLRIMAPSGAPMKNMIRQATESVYFFRSSISCRRRILRSSAIVAPLNSKSSRSRRMLCIAPSTTIRLPLSSSFESSESSISGLFLSLTSSGADCMPGLEKLLRWPFSMASGPLCSSRV